MNILFVEPAGAGGIAHYTYALANALAKEGVASHILTGTRWNLPDFSNLVTVHRIFQGMRTSPVKLYKTCSGFNKRVDLIHWQSASHARLIYLLMRFLPIYEVPWIFTVHNVLPHEHGESSIPLYSKIYKRQHGLIFHTEYSQREYQLIFPELEKISAVIPLGEYGFLVNPESLEKTPPRPHQILFFGNIRYYKGLDILLHALPLIRQEFPDTRLVIAGQPLQEFEPYEKIIREYNLSENVELRLGYLPDEEIAPLFMQTSIVALPYRSIDQSAVLLLAMALGKTVVASNVGGIPEVIEHNRTGILTDPENPESLAGAIRELFRAPDSLHRLGSAAQQETETRFSWDQIAEKTRQFYEDVLRAESKR